MIWLTLACWEGNGISAQTREEIETLHTETKQCLTDNILPFWMEKTIDPKGGFYGIVLDDGKPIEGYGKGAILNARILWTFSKAYRHMGLEEYRRIADRAADYYIQHFIDKEYGGVFWSVDDKGEMKDATKQTYACAFGIYGLSEHFRATGEQKSLDAALALYQTIESRVHDKAKKGYIETFMRDYSKSNMKGVDGQENATKTMNTHIHLLEAYTTLYQVWQDKRLRENLIELIDILSTKLYSSSRNHLILFCDDDWNPIGESDSYGHDIETSWLMCEAANTIGDPEIKTRAHTQAVKMARTALEEGLNAEGAMRYEKTKDGYSKKMSWWPQCETIIGAINAWQLTGDKMFFEAAQKTWEYVKAHFIDTEHGGWYKGLTEDGTPTGEPKVNDWNCPYHNSRVSFEMMERLDPRHHL